jgi:hypothetical protein
MAFPTEIFCSQENEVHIDFLKSGGSEVMDRKRGENQGPTSHMLWSSSKLTTKSILGYRDEDMLFSVMFSWTGIW